MACRILVQWSGIKPMSPAVEAQSLNHWTVREVPWGNEFYRQCEDSWKRTFPWSSLQMSVQLSQHLDQPCESLSRESFWATPNFWLTELMSIVFSCKTRGNLLCCSRKLLHWANQLPALGQVPPPGLFLWILSSVNMCTWALSLVRSENTVEHMHTHETRHMWNEYICPPPIL